MACDELEKPGIGEKVWGGMPAEFPPDLTIDSFQGFPIEGRTCILFPGGEGETTCKPGFADSALAHYQHDFIPQTP